MLYYELQRLKFDVGNTSEPRTPISNPADMPTPSCYAGAEARLNRWLEKYQRDRAEHEKARRSHADPATLDADFALVVRAMGLIQCHLHLTELRVATALLHEGARATIEHFQDYELSSKNLGDIVDLMLAHSWSGASAVVPELAAFLEALTSSGSETVLTNKRYVGNGGMPLPFFVLHSVTVGDPWGSAGNNDLGSSRDRALRRVCLRLLARMAFLSAERALARGAAHPFMVLLETMHGPKVWGEILPFDVVRAPLLVHTTNQSAFLQVLFLMIFVHRRFPWPSRGQYQADAQYRGASRPLSAWDGIELTNKMAQIVLTVPGVLQALVVDLNFWHILVAHGVGIRVDSVERPPGYKKRNLGEYCLNACFGSRTEEDKLVALLRDTRLLSKWFCGEAGRHLLLEACRQRRRRVVQVRRMATM